MAGIAATWLLPSEWPDSALAFSVTALVLTAALAVLWRGKSAAEERLLVARFEEYEDYRRRTPRRFLPGLY